MKKIYLSLSLIFTSVIGFAQIGLVESETGLPAVLSYTYTVASGSPTETHVFEIHNNSSGSLTLRAKRYLLNNASGQEAYFCFGTQCYSFNTNAFYAPSSAVATVPAGGMLPSGQGTYGLTTDFDDYTVMGNTRVLYVIYDQNNPNDSVSVEISYDVTPVGLAKIDAKNFAISNAMPNPAVNNVSLKYNFASQPKSSYIRVYNMVGVLVKEIRVDGTEGKAQFDVSNFTEGVYFYSLIVNDKTVSTKRLIVSK